MTLHVGEIAPSFKLYNTEKKEINLADYKGKNLTVLFFPLAFSSVCTKELCSVRDDISFFSGIDSEVVGISVDSLYSLSKFKEEQHLNFELLSDFNKEASKAYDCLYDNFVLGMKEVSKRSAFVIDKAGVIQYAEVLESAGDMPNIEAIKTVLKDLN